MQCFTPPWQGVGATAVTAATGFDVHRVPVRLALNGEQFQTSRVDFVYHHDVQLSAVTPVTYLLASPPVT